MSEARKQTHLIKKALAAPLSIRFWEKVEKTDTCWLWTGSRDGDGYGRLYLGGGREDKAHRLAWKLAKGDIPAGLYVCHHCDTPPCVNPQHLFLGTPKENARDSLMKGRLAHPHTPQSKAKISAAHKGKACTEEELERLRHLFEGHKHTAETKQKISLIHRGRAKSQETRDRMREARRRREEARKA